MNPEGRAIEKAMAVYKETLVKTPVVSVHERINIFDRLTKKMVAQRRGERMIYASSLIPSLLGRQFLTL